MTFLYFCSSFVFFLIRSCPLILAVECNRDWEEGFALSYSLHIVPTHSHMLDFTLSVLHLHLLVKTQSIVYKHCPRKSPPHCFLFPPLGLPKTDIFRPFRDQDFCCGVVHTSFGSEVNVQRWRIHGYHEAHKPGCWESQAQSDRSKRFNIWNSFHEISPPSSSSIKPSETAVSTKQARKKESVIKQNTQNLYSRWLHTLRTISPRANISGDMASARL